MGEVQRDEKGRFVEGTVSPNPGGTSSERLAYRQALEGALSVEAFTEIIGKLVAAAKDGKPWAIKEVMVIALGRDFNLHLVNKVREGLRVIIERPNPSNQGGEHGRDTA